jgi:putative AlgH/UPF0301 family transcriptional regulator
MKKTLAAIALLAAAMAAPAFAFDLSEPVLLVAKPQLTHRLYGASILIVMPLGADEHIGFIVNRPTTMSIEALFPGAEPSYKVVDRLYLGGPVGLERVFAMVQRPDSPGGRSLRVTQDLFVASDPEVVDRIIESEADHARFVAGLVAWTRGELSAEVEAGAWYVLAPDAELVTRDPDGLWEELVRRAQRARDTI